MDSVAKSRLYLYARRPNNKQYTAFWTNPHDVEPHWLALFLALASVGAELSGQARKDLEMLAIGEKLRVLSTHAIVLSNYATPKPYTIQSILLYTKSLLCKAHDVTTQIWLLFGLVTRLSMQVGLHQDVGDNAHLSRFQCEMRRRLWLIVRIYDIKMCYQRGVLCLINQNSFSTRPPSNLLDEDFSTEHVPMSRPSEEFTPVLSAIAYARLESVFADIILSAAASKDPSDSEISGFHQKLVATREQLPLVLRFRPLDQSLMDPADVLLSRFELELLHLKAICILYRRYVTSYDSDATRNTAERLRCLDAAEDSIQVQIALLDASHSDGQLAGTGPLIAKYVHDFNLAAMLLCAELKHSSTAKAKSSVVPTDMLRADRMRELVSRACASWNHENIASVKAQRALRAIQRFVDDRPPIAGPMRTGASTVVDTKGTIDFQLDMPAAMVFDDNTDIWNGAAVLDLTQYNDLNFAQDATLRTFSDTSFDFLGAPIL